MASDTPQLPLLLDISAAARFVGVGSGVIGGWGLAFVRAGRAVEKDVFAAVKSTCTKGDRFSIFMTPFRFWASFHLIARALRYIAAWGGTKCLVLQ